MLILMACVIILALPSALLIVPWVQDPAMVLVIAADTGLACALASTMLMRTKTAFATTMKMAPALPGWAMAMVRATARVMVTVRATAMAVAAAVAGDRQQLEALRFPGQMPAYCC